MRIFSAQTNEVCGKKLNAYMFVLRGLYYQVGRALADIERMIRSFTCAGFVLGFAFLGLFLSACQQTKELPGSQTGRQAIEMAAVLSRAKIASQLEKTSSGKEEKFHLFVSESDYSRALEVLNEFKVPHNEEIELESLTKPSGFGPQAPQLWGLRLDYVLSLQLERQLQSLDGVVEARVIVRSNFKGFDSPQENKAKPTASAVIRYLAPAGNLPFSAAKIKEIILRAIPGIAPEDILVDTSRVLLPTDEGIFGPVITDKSASSLSLPGRTIFGLHVLPEDRKGFLILFALGCLAGCILGIGISQWALARAREQQRRIQKMSAKDNKLRSSSGEQLGDTQRSLKIPQLRQ